ncbi:MAG: hypothetical protein WD096_08840 [Actinomycetota bacterium]
MHVARTFLGEVVLALGTSLVFLQVESHRARVWVLSVGIGLALLLLVGSFIYERGKAARSAKPSLEARILALVKTEARSLDQLGVMTGAAKDLVRAATADLAKTGTIEIRGGGMVVAVGRAEERDTAMPITPVGGRVTRREQIFDEIGRLAGEETVTERRDAKPMPETVAATAAVPTPTVIGASALETPPTLPDAAMVQGPRSGWKAWSEVDLQQGHGVVLVVESAGEEARGFRCRVIGPDGGSVDYEQVPAKARMTSLRVHYPKAFPRALHQVRGVSKFQFMWLGHAADEGDETLLAGNTFKVNEMGQYFARGAPE